jgi:hypothetical protein
MPKYTSSKLAKLKYFKDLALDDDPVMEFYQYKKAIASSVPMHSHTNNSSLLDDIFFSDYEEAPSQQFSQAFGSEDMIEKGAHINVVNIFQKSRVIPIPIKPTLESQDTDNTIVSNAQVNDYPTLVIRAHPVTNPVILEDANAAEID